MPGRQSAGSTAIDEDNPGSTEGASLRVTLRPVVGSVAAPLLDRTDPILDEAALDDVDEPVHTLMDDLPWSSLPAPSVRTAPVMISLGIGTAVGLATGDVAFGVWSGLCVWFVIGLRWVSRHVSVSIADGFVGYRPDPAWPLGVQEDDDLRWDWTVKPEPSDDDDSIGTRG